MKILGIVLLATASAALPGGSAAQPATAVKEFTLTAREIRLRLASGAEVAGWAYNGRIPGPEIRVTEGDRVRITFKNELPVASSVHWHGVHVPWTMDGPPGINQRAVGPGESFVYEFVARPAGTRFYHSHGSGNHDEALQMDMGLYGAFVIEEKNEPKVDREYTLVLSERLSTLDPAAGRPGGPGAGPGAGGGHGAHGSGPGAHGSGAGGHGAHGSGGGAPQGGHRPHGGGPHESDTFLINGKSWPAAPALRVKQGERVRLRLINAGSSSIHPMHLHGHSFRVVAVDGNRLPAPLLRDVVPLTPGERYDIEFVADNPGVWLFHCHELHHMDAGMAVLIQYEGYDTVDKGAPPPAAAPHGPGMRH